MNRSLTLQPLSFKGHEEECTIMYESDQERRIGDFLIEVGILTPQQVRKVLYQQRCRKLKAIYTAEKIHADASLKQHIQDILN